MSKLGLGCLVACVVLMPHIGSAQVTQLPRVVTDPATDARIVVTGDPIYFGGRFYYPSGPITFFDPNVMSRAGTYDGIAVYTNSVQEPGSIIYLPIGGTSLRPYERLRAGELGGTTGSRTPSFPVQPPVNSPYLSSLGGPLMATVQSPPGYQPAPTAAQPSAPQPQHVRIVMIPAPTGDSGLWVEFGGTRWYHEGESVTLEGDSFDQIGSYKGFSVYRPKSGDDRTIFVQTQRDGNMLARYVKR